VSLSRVRLLLVWPVSASLIPLQLALSPMMGLARRCELARLVSVNGLQHADTSEYHRAIAFGGFRHAMRGHLNDGKIML